jgi:hypothetical protein
VLDQRRDRLRFQRDDSLVKRSAILRIEGDREPAVGGAAGKLRERCDLRQRRSGLLPLRGGAKRQIGVGFDDEQAHRPIALQLDDQRALELERGGEQRSGGKELGHDASQRRRVRMTVENLPARAIEAHQRTAHGCVLEHETRERVGERRMGSHRAAPQRFAATV